MKEIYSCTFFLFIPLLIIAGSTQKGQLHFCGSAENDLYQLVLAENFEVFRYDNPLNAVSNAPSGTAVIIAAGGYPEEITLIPEGVYELASQKNIRLYVEYPRSVPGLEISGKKYHAQLERGVVTSSVFGETLKPMARRPGSLKRPRYPNAPFLVVRVLPYCIPGIRWNINLAPWPILAFREIMRSPSL